MSNPLRSRESRLSVPDSVLAIFLAVVVFLLAVFSITNNCPWGDDFAAYILQGISIADGSFDQQIRLNHLLHPSYMPEEAVNGELVYVWGYSLLLALVYALVGFDQIGYSTVIYYKLPSVFALSLLAAVFYLFLRRRFGKQLSFLLSFLFCCCGEFIGFIDSMYSDVVFLSFAMLTLYLGELYLAQENRRRLLLALLLGVSLWFTYEIRLSGISILFAFALSHILWLIPQKGKLTRHTFLKECLPYLIFLLFKIVSEALLAPATSNSSDLDGAGLATIYYNVLNYASMTFQWYLSIWNRILTGLMGLGVPFARSEIFFYLQTALTYASLVLCAIGLFFDGFKKNLPYTVFLAVYLFVTSMLPFNQGLRYIYPLLPLLFMYTGYGLGRLLHVLFKNFTPTRLTAFLSAALVAILCVSLSYPQLQRIRLVRSTPGHDGGYISLEESAKQNAYSSSALEAYAYVKDHVPKDKVIAFFKPRVLYLNTGRASYVAWEIIDRSLDDADYYLVYHHVILNPVPGDEFVPVWENQDFVMLRRQD